LDCNPPFERCLQCQMLDECRTTPPLFNILWITPESGMSLFVWNFGLFGDEMDWDTRQEPEDLGLRV